MDVDISKNLILAVIDEKKLTKAFAASIFELNDGSLSISAALIELFLFGLINGLILFQSFFDDVTVLSMKALKYANFFILNIE
jgi:hypothetical protein